MMKRILSLFALVALAPLLAGMMALRPGLAQQGGPVAPMVAHIVASEGPVEIKRDRSTGGKLQAQTIAFKVDDQVFVGDTIVTGKNGKLVLALSDGSQAVIAAKSTVVVADLQQTPRTFLQLLKGKTRIQIQKLGGQPNPYRVTTPTAVIAVRGTVFDVEVDDDQTEVYLHEGAVDVFNQALPSQPVFLNPGQTTRIQARRPPLPPRVFQTGRNDGLYNYRELRNRPANGANSAGNGRIAQRDQSDNPASTNSADREERTANRTDAKDRPASSRPENARSLPPSPRNDGRLGGSPSPSSRPAPGSAKPPQSPVGRRP